MAKLVNKLHVKKDGRIFECTCYTTPKEATPNYTGASYWEIKNNNTVCYVGLRKSPSVGYSLFPIAEPSEPLERPGDIGGSYDTPLTVKKNGIPYIVQTEVNNGFTVKITQSANQTIDVLHNGQHHTTDFLAMAGDKIVITITPATGFMAGAPIVSGGTLQGNSLFVNNNITITAGPATKAKYLVTINQSPHQTITVIHYKDSRETRYTTSFQVEHNDIIAMLISAEQFYTAGKLSITGSYQDNVQAEVMKNITGNVTISASPAEIMKHTITVQQPTNGHITVNGQTGTSFAINHGSQVTVEAVADSGYVVEGLYME